MPTTLQNATKKYVKARDPSLGTRREYQTTIAKWQRWKGRVSIERLDRPTIREFLSWVHDQAVADGGTNPGRTSNKARTHLRAVISWAWENDLIEMPPRFPKPVPFKKKDGAIHKANLARQASWRSLERQDRSKIAYRELAHVKITTKTQHSKPPV